MMCCLPPVGLALYRYGKDASIVSADGKDASFVGADDLKLLRSAEHNSYEFISAINSVSSIFVPIDVLE